MKPTTKSAILGAVLSAAAILAATQFIPSKAQAQGQAKVPAEQYRVLEMAEQPTTHAEDETKLNSLAADGWRVRIAAGRVVILAKSVP